MCPRDRGEIKIPHLRDGASLLVGRQGAGDADIDVLEVRFEPPKAGLAGALEGFGS